MSVKDILVTLFTLLLSICIIKTARPGGGKVVSKTCAEIRCNSSSSRRVTCAIPNAEKRVISHVRLKRQISKAKCKGNFGTTNNTIWIHKGCKGIFKYCFVPGKVEKPVLKHCSNIRCSSLVFRPVTCSIPSNRIMVSVSIKKKTSLSNCGGRYGFKNNSIWVNGGCRGLFRYCYVSGKPRLSIPKTKKINLKCSAMQCSSEDFKYTTCTVPINRLIKNITLTKQKSLTSCRTPNDKFGFDNNVVWVNKGCSGLFKYCYVRRPPKKDWLICESKNSDVMTCPISWKVTRIVTVRKRSRAKCIKGISYGVRKGTIWVAKSCRAKFIFLRDDKVPAKVGEIDCSSDDKVYVKCRIPRNRRIKDVTLKQQYSTTNCKLPTPKFGLTRDNSIWVYQGCQGRFKYGYTEKR